MGGHGVAKESETGRTTRLIELVTRLFYGVTALSFAVFACSLVGIAISNLVRATFFEHALLQQTLESIGLITIALAVFDVGRFLIEEEILRDRELRSATEARRTLTKFFSIIIIAVCLEAIVLVFEKKSEQVETMIYPTALLAVGVFALIGLGLFQRLSAPARQQDGAAAKAANQQPDKA